MTTHQTLTESLSLRKAIFHAQLVIPQEFRVQYSRDLHYRASVQPSAYSAGKAVAFQACGSFFYILYGPLLSHSSSTLMKSSVQTLSCLRHIITHLFDAENYSYFRKFTVPHVTTLILGFLHTAADHRARWDLEGLGVHVRRLTRGSAGPWPLLKSVSLSLRS